MNSVWIQSQLTPLSPGFWLALSFVSLPLVLIVGARLSMRRQRWLFAARWVLIPYAGLMTGGLSPRLMGLSKINWATTLGLGVALFFGLLLLTIGVRIFVISNSQDGGETRQKSLDGSRSGWADIGLTVLVTGAEQFHWSFIRGAIWALLLTWPQPFDGSPAYRSLWIATLVTLPEIWLQPLAGSQRLLKSVLLVVTAIVFFYTRNFWLVWLLYAAAWLVLTQRTPGIDADTRPVVENG